MAKLKLGPIADEKPVRITAEIPAEVHRDLVAYARVLGQQTGKTYELSQLVAPMLKRFMETDREFAKARRSGQRSSQRIMVTSASEPAPNLETA